LLDDFELVTSGTIEQSYEPTGLRGQLIYHSKSVRNQIKLHVAAHRELLAVDSGVVALGIWISEVRNFSIMVQYNMGSPA
jgi:hypothetical protein